MTLKVKAVLLLAALTVSTAAAQAKKTGTQAQAGPAYPPQIEGALVEVYKTIGSVKLNMYIFNPPGHKKNDKAPAIVFFFGGGWRSGSPVQFEQQCRHLAGRGMVAMAADYRVASRHNVQVVDCLRDAKSAIRWVRQNAARLGVDPNRIAAGGGSAGGHLAAAVGTIAEFDEPSENSSISSRPNAMVLFNPALVLAPIEGMDMGRAELVRERTGVDPIAVSPCHHVKAGAPPAIIFHGKADTTVPYATAEKFDAAMKKAGNRCELIGYDGATHGFFNFGRDGNKAYPDTIARMDRFLASLGYLAEK